MSVDRSVLLYGSHARGDHDRTSDVDILLVSPEPLPYDELGVPIPLRTGPVHVSHYTWPEMIAMGAYGSLFLRHLKSEALSIRHDGDGEARLAAILGSLGPYQLSERDVNAFEVTVDDVLEGLSYGLPPHFEMAVLGGVARHASVLACYLGGSPSFGRRSIQEATAQLGMPDSQGDLALAHTFRLYEQGQCSLPVPLGIEQVVRVAETLREFLNRLEGLIHADAA